MGCRAVRRLLACLVLVGGFVGTQPGLAQSLATSPPSCCSLGADLFANPPFANVATSTQATVSLTNQPAVQIINGNVIGSNPAVNNTPTLNVTINPSAFGAVGPPYAVGVFGHGAVDMVDGGENAVQALWAIGPTLSIGNNASVSLTSPGPVPLGYPFTDTTPFLLASTLLAASSGAGGFFQTARKTPANSSVYNGATGGSVAITNSGSITVSATAVSGFINTPWDPYASAVAAVSAGGNGVGGKTNDNDIGGNGGNGGTIAVTTLPGSQITIQGAGAGAAPLNGITAYSQGGGSGCDCHGDVANLHGASGSGGSVTVTHNGGIASAASNSIGISAVSIGGDGGLSTGHGVGAAPGTSGPGGAVQVTLNSGASINLTGGDSIGVLAASSVGPSAQSNTSNSGGPVTVTINPGATIAASGGGAFNIGVAAISTGSPDILQPFTQSSVNANGSGFSGAVNVTNNGTISTNGALAIGVAALSLGGSGVFTTASSAGTSALGNAGSYSNGGGTVSVSNTGSITTNGGSAFGILAASNGAGGLLNLAPNLVGGGLTSIDIIGGQTASNNGNGGSVTVTDSGAITTGDGSGGGKLAIGILAQSIGGGGGSSGGSGVAFLVGDAGGSGGSGGPVSVAVNGGQVTTRDDGAIGILAQSIGGGGGNAGNAAGLFVATGGTGGNGGSGNQVAVSLSSANGSGGVTTSGDFAAGVVAQSIGGGGGNGGYGESAGIFVTSAIGGQGGNGGNGYTSSGFGGSATTSTTGFSSDVAIRTSGEQSHGVLVQSIGGGGGNGGAATSLAVGASFAVSIAVGGRGGSGGAGGTVNATNQGLIVTLGPDSMGLIAQSVGGGGGNGGAATAKSWAIASLPDIPTISFSTALGGAGGAGGNGGTVTVVNQTQRPGSSGGQIATTGNAAHGVLAQSIGGGGGNGGDSTATSLAFEGDAPTIKIGVSLGGSGNVAGSGQSVIVNNGATTDGNGTVTGCAGCTGMIATAGNNAAGIVAQSIGAGGGNGGAGNASTSSENLGLGGVAVSATYAMGGQGSASGNGGAVTVTNGAGSAITTIGYGAQGILAQSIGGGGGNAGGGSAAGSADDLNINVSVGASGSAGGSGGGVIVINSGRITTAGGDAVGIGAQSIGGGGGMAGSSDADASVSKRGQVEDQFFPPANSYSANIAIGGHGGTGGNGGTVAVTNGGSITTLGIRAYGILAQSIGDGGGSGGAATSAANSVLGGPSGSEKGATYAATLSIGGSAGGGGSGSTITIDNSGNILTAGYGAHAILAQSVGGGGGVGAEGTANNTTTIGLGAASSGSGGQASNGGTVTVTSSGFIGTVGDEAYGIVAQSIGGGGGAAGAGCSNSASSGIQGVSATRCFGNTGAGASGNVAPWNDATSLTLQLGGSSGASGFSGPVTISESGAIQTTGARSFGIVAQSIGGGGGIVGASAVNLVSTNLQTRPGQNRGNAYPVTVTLAPGASIATAGGGAWGILAQSIGGGGGFAGDPSLPMQFPQSNTLPPLNPSSTSNSQYPDADTVTVNVSGSITTTGANAHGVFAQSVGGGGGIAAGCCNSAGAVLVAGNSAQLYSIGGEIYSGIGRAVTISQSPGSTIRTSGPGSIGIVAQSTGNAAFTTPITVTIGGAVIGGTNSGYNFATGGTGAAGILLSGGGAVGNPNSIAVNAGGSVSTMDGVGGTAITTNYGLTNVSNAGTITGSVDLGIMRGTISNSGTLNTGATVAAASLDNAGTLNVFGPGRIGTTALDGNLLQTNGRLVVDIDSLAVQQADLLQVSGGVSGQGLVVPIAVALLPGAIPAITAQGNFNAGINVASSLLFDWSGSFGTAGGIPSFSIAPSANFAPPGVSMTPSEASLATNLTNAWNNADRSYAAKFGFLSQIDSARVYTATLDAFSARATQAQSLALANSAGTILGASMSCPVFVDRSVLLGEDNCVWAKLTGQQSNQWQSSDTAGYQVASALYRIGGQHAIAPGWYLGGSLAAGQTWASANGGSSGHGHTFDGSVALKHTMGPWTIGGAVALASGAFHSSRVVSLPAVGTLPAVYAVESSDPSIFVAGGRLRAPTSSPSASGMFGHSAIST